MVKGGILYRFSIHDILEGCEAHDVRMAMEFVGSRKDKGGFLFYFLNRRLLADPGVLH
jgi:hypothetical protein